VKNLHRQIAWGNGLLLFDYATKTSPDSSGDFTALARKRQKRVMDARDMINGRGWGRPDDVYDACFAAVEGPAWHGRNFNALRDSLARGRIKKMDPPYVIKMTN
jgi:hypothetical protein